LVRLLVLGLCVVSLVLLACQAGGDEEPVAGPSDDAEVPSPAPDSSDVSCDGAQYVDGDFDGDGITDRAYLHESESSLVVCSGADTAVLEVGRLELFMASDVDLDGRDEILAGGTTAWGQVVEIVALVDGELDYVADPTGGPLSLWRGLPPGRVLASGCGSFTASGSRELATIDGTVDDSGSVEWQRTVYRIDGHRAVDVLNDAGAFDASSSPDPLSTEAMRDLVGDPC